MRDGCLETVRLMGTAKLNSSLKKAAILRAARANRMLDELYETKRPTGNAFAGCSNQVY